MAQQQKHDPEMGGFLTTREVAAMFGVTIGRIHQLVPLMDDPPEKWGVHLVWRANNIASLRRLRGEPMKHTNCP